ncbi:hypothetical protein M407DRAFT_34609 [Tulasnella calospora MUT 4182]|uniref:Uncharacterized protein n=1 Tax=Tulasnella calospora MUT 4182 TaxID=1051891 RepID=A0A0C3Q115_9AGAM|nr:hypothetical protein M407DRAFT_34609 [Tulasnella calospora MUT 4182]
MDSLEARGAAGPGHRLAASHSYIPHADTPKQGQAQEKKPKKESKFLPRLLLNILHLDHSRDVLRRAEDPSHLQPSASSRRLAAALPGPRLLSSSLARHSEPGDKYVLCLQPRATSSASPRAITGTSPHRIRSRRIYLAAHHQQRSSRPSSSPSTTFRTSCSSLSERVALIKRILFKRFAFITKRFDLDLTTGLPAASSTKGPAISVIGTSLVSASAAATGSASASACSSADAAAWASKAAAISVVGTSSVQASSTSTTAAPAAT